MKQTYCNTPDDCTWLLKTKLGNRPELAFFKSFILYGNEDCPERVDLYESDEPLITDTPHTLTFL